jgi:N-methylhydantoinase A
LRRAFEAAYRAQYGRLVAGIDIEILTWTVTVHTAERESTPVPDLPVSAAPPASRSRGVFDVGTARRLATAIYRRADLPPGSALSGPAIIEEDATSTVIGPAHEAQIAADGTIVIMRKQPA